MADLQGLKTGEKYTEAYSKLVADGVNAALAAVTFAADAIAPGSPAGNVEVQLQWVLSQITTGTPPVLATLTQVLSIGDSLCFGDETTDPATKRWSAQMLGLLASSQFAGPFVFAQNSTRLVQEIPYKQLPDALAAIDRTAYKQAVLFVGGGLNDFWFQGATVAQLKAARLAIISAVRTWQAEHDSFPVKVVFLSVPPMQGSFGLISLAEYEARRKAFNDDWLANYATYGADYYVNKNAAPELLDPANATYYVPSKLHTNDAGALVLASLVKPTLLAAHAGTALAPLPDYVAPGGGEEPAPVLTVTATVEESDAGWLYSGAFDQANGGLTAGGALYTQVVGRYAERVFPNARQFNLLHGDFGADGLPTNYEVWVDGVLDGTLSIPGGSANRNVALRYTTKVYPAGSHTLRLVCNGMLLVDQVQALN